MNEIKDVDNKALSILTEMDSCEEGGRFKSPLVKVAEILKKAGIYIPQIEAALLTFITLNSARLNKRSYCASDYRRPPVPGLPIYFQSART